MQIKQPTGYGKSWAIDGDFSAAFYSYRVIENKVWLCSIGCEPMSILESGMAERFIGIMESGDEKK